MAHPLFGLFAEPASTMIVTTEPNQVAAIEELADEYGYFVARIGTTGGDRLEINVYRQPMISAPLASLRAPWSSALEATLHGEVTGMTQLPLPGRSRSRRRHDSLSPPDH